MTSPSKARTLVGAIYSFIDLKEVAEGVDAQKIYRQLAAAYGWSTRKFLDERKNRQQRSPVTCNGCTKCPRQNWYKFNGIPGEPMHPRGKLNFRTGGIVELELYMYAALGGADVDFYQHRYDWNIGDENNVMCNTSAYIDFRWTKPDGKRVLVDVKTMSDFGYKRFVAEGPDDAFGYEGQFSQYIAAALRAGDIDEPGELVVLGYKKSTGHIHQHSVFANEALLEQARSNAVGIDQATAYQACPRCPASKSDARRFQTCWCGRRYIATNEGSFCHRCEVCYGKKFIPDAVHGSPPERPDWLKPKQGSDGEWTLALQCNYCDHKYACWTYPRMDDIQYEWDDEGEMVVRYPGSPIQKLEIELVRGKPKFHIKKDKRQMEIEYDGA